MNTEDRFRIRAIIEFYSSLMEQSDPFDDGHEERSSVLGGALATELRMPIEFVEMVEYCLSLHDAGKIMIAESIRNKPKLSDSEMDQVRGHAHYGAKAVMQVSVDKAVKQFLYDGLNHHHENWNGSGYPDKLLREQIPPQARIMRIVDTWDALTHNRPYRKALSNVNALVEMEKEIGISFDPTMFYVFKRMVDG